MEEIRRLINAWAKAFIKINIKVFDKMDGDEKRKAQIGSATAKGGFQNERDIASKFNSWKSDPDAQKWLETMDYKIKDIDYVKAIVLSGFKTDVQVQIKLIIHTSNGICIENLSIKKANINSDYNQLDKRWVDKYQELWRFSDSIAKSLKKFTGELSPMDLLNKKIISEQQYNNLRDKRRFFLDELSTEEQNEILEFFKENKILVITDLFKGRDKFAPTYMMVTRYDNRNNVTDWILTPINIAMNFFGSGDIVISKQGNLHIGKITMQRKGGDAGRETAQMLQFKIKPNLLFSLL